MGQSLCRPPFEIAEVLSISVMCSEAENEHERRCNVPQHRPGTEEKAACILRS